VRATLRQGHYYNQRYSKEGELIGSEHTGALTQWLSSVYRDNIKYRKWTLPDAVVILRDQAEGRLLRQMNYIVARTNIPSNRNSAGMGIESQDWPDNVSSAQEIRLQLGRYDLVWNEP